MGLSAHGQSEGQLRTALLILTRAAWAITDARTHGPEPLSEFSGYY